MDCGGFGLADGKGLLAAGSQTRRVRVPYRFFDNMVDILFKLYIP